LQISRWVCGQGLADRVVFLTPAPSYMSSERRWVARVVVITGGSAGVGRACARTFAERGSYESGARRLSLPGNFNVSPRLASLRRALGSLRHGRLRRHFPTSW
jgi:hypothetical protein